MHDWNAREVVDEVGRGMGARPRVVDETLRDGLQSAAAHDPSLDDKRALLHAMATIGVDAVSIGLPAAGPRAARDAAELAREIARAHLALRPTAAARTTEADVHAIADVSQKAGVAVEVYAFIGCSPIRRFVEEWSMAWLLERVRVAGRTARAVGLPFCLVMEDTTRTPPAALREVFAAAIDAGALRLCLCDTVGHADPHGAEALVGFARATLAELGAPHVELDWHGHNDRGLALGNAIAAVRAGVDGVHGTARGIGERTGNVPVEHLLAQLAAIGARGPASAAAIEAYTRAAIIGESAPDASVDRPAMLRLRVNGDPIELAARPSRTLVELLRYDLDLVGVKQGCDEGDCGACTVLVDGRPVLSCITLAHACEGRDVTTVESLAGAPALDPLLDAFDRRGAGQCGFCTSGMVLTAKALLARDPRPSRAAIREAISGNLCRCTGYGAIVDAIEDASRGGADDRAPPLPGEECPPAPLPPHGAGS